MHEYGIISSFEIVYTFCSESSTRNIIIFFKTKLKMLKRVDDSSKKIYYIQFYVIFLFV